jgi:probable phosphoglycerate mutase
MLALLGRRATRPAPDALLTSPLTRARDVAALLAHKWAREAQTASWASEIHCGLVEGMPFDRLRREFAAVWRQNEAEADDAFAWPGGETYARFRERVVFGLQLATAAYQGGRVAVVTHAGVISQVLGVFRQRPAAVWSADRPAPLTATEIVWTRRGPSAVLAFNDPDWF